MTTAASQIRVRVTPSKAEPTSSRVKGGSTESRAVRRRVACRAAVAGVGEPVGHQVEAADRAVAGHEAARGAGRPPGSRRRTRRGPSGRRSGRPPSPTPAPRTCRPSRRVRRCRARRSSTSTTTGGRGRPCRPAGAGRWASVGHQGGDLGDGVDEHEVEEEFGGCDPVSVRRGCRAGCVRRASSQLPFRGGHFAFPSHAAR